MSDPLTIRPFRGDDLEGVTSLWAFTIADPKPWNEPRQAIVRKLLAGDGLFLVAERDQKIVGSVQAGFDGVRGWIYKLAVSPERRYEGVGRRLLAEAEQRLAAKGCRKVNLQVRGTNAGVIAFYERCGYGRDDVLSLGKALPFDVDAVAEPVPTIEVGDGITLSQVVRADKPAYLKHLNVSDVFRKNLALMPYPYTELDAEVWITRAMRETVAADRCRNWAIRENGELIGGIGLRDLVVGEIAEFGYWLAVPWWGQGLMTKVAQAVCEDAFQRYRLRKIHAGAYGTNPASCRVLEKAGFVREGVLRGHFCREGEAIDVIRYGRLRED
jgi:RimJ/RimL family protein N-acetyltransferase